MEIWTKWGKPFNEKYFIKDRDFWNRFWDNCTYTEKQIYISLRNIFYACKSGYYGERYISPDPCQFIKGNMLDRGLSDELNIEFDMNYPDDKNLQLFND